MSLKKILNDISTELGISPPNDNEREWLINKVNDAAKELYESQDINGCLREQTFAIDNDSSQSSMVSLPHYIDQLRGIRWTQIVGGKVPLNDMTPRYHAGKGWGENSFALPYRIVRDAVPLAADIVNAGRLTFTLAKIEAVDITIVVVGETELSDNTQEIVVIEAGCFSVSTEGNFLSIKNIEKAALNNYNIVVTDIQGNELAIIPNSELSPSYKWLELLDSNAGFYQAAPILNNSIDILYKTKFVPFRNLYDEFVCGSKCDRAIFYQFVSFVEAQKTGNEVRALGFVEKAKGILDNLNTDKETGVNMELQFAPSGLIEAQQPFNSSYYYGRRLQ